MADPLKTLIDGLKVHWDANVTLSVLKLYLDEKPADLSVGFPYYVLKLEPSTLLGYTSAGKIWNHTLEVRAYAATTAVAGTALEVVTDIYDADAFTLTLADSHKFTSSRRIQAAFPNAGKEVDSALARYRMQTWQPRT